VTWNPLSIRDMVHRRSDACRFVFSHKPNMRDLPVRRVYNVKMAIPVLDERQRENRAKRNALRVAMNYDSGLSRTT